MQKNEKMIEEGLLIRGLDDLYYIIGLVVKRAACNSACLVQL